MTQNRYTKYDHRRIVELMLANNPASVVAERMGCTTEYVGRVWSRYRATGDMPPKRPADATPAVRYTPEQKRWVRKTYPHYSNADVAAQYNRRYGTKLKPHHVQSLAHRMGLRKDPEYLSQCRSEARRSNQEHYDMMAAVAVSALSDEQRRRLAAMLATPAEWRRYRARVAGGGA